MTTTIEEQLDKLAEFEFDLQQRERDLENYLAQNPESQNASLVYAKKRSIDSSKGLIATTLSLLLTLDGKSENHEGLGSSRRHFVERYFQACDDAGRQPDISRHIEYLYKREDAHKSEIIETFKKYPPSNFKNYKEAIFKISELYPDILVEDFPKFAVLYAIWPPCEKNRYLIPQPELHEQAMAALVAYLANAQKEIPPDLSYEGDWYSETKDAELLLSLKRFQNESDSEATIIDDIIEKDQWLKAFWIYQEYMELDEDENIDELRTQWEANESDYLRSFECAKNEEIDRWYGNLLDFSRLKIMEFLLSKIDRKNNHFSEHISIITSAQISEFIFEVFRTLVKFADYPIGPIELYDESVEDEEEIENAFRKSANVDFDFSESAFAFMAWKICHIRLSFCTPRDYEFKDFVIWDWAEPEKIKLFWVAWVNKFSGSLDDPKTLLNDRDGLALDATLSWLDEANDFKTLISVASILKSHPDNEIASKALQKLSKCALEGNGMLRSKKKALAYLLVAKVTDEAGRNIYAKRLREQISDLEDKMSQDQISSAEELAEEIYENLNG